MSKTPFDYALMMSLFAKLHGAERKFMLRSPMAQQKSKNRTPHAAGQRHKGFTNRTRLFGRTVYLNKLRER